MKRFLTILMMFVALTAMTFSQQSFKNGFGTSAFAAGVNDLGNTVNVQSIWTDGAVGTVSGMYSWSFDVTSTYVTISTANITLHTSISSNFDITKTAITNGVRVSITGKTNSKYLVDAGNVATDTAFYNTVKIVFDAPASAGSGTIVITNNASGVRRLTASSHTPSTQTVSNGPNLTLAVTTTTAQTVVVAPTNTSPYVKLGVVRKVGDINWDGNVDISDVTGLLNVANKNYSVVLVDTTAGAGTDRAFYAGNANNKTLDSLTADVASNSPSPEALDLLDVAVLQDAVLNAEWPSYALASLAGKPLQKVGDVVSVLCEISNAGTGKARVRFSLSSADGVDGLQVYIPATMISKNITGYSLIPTANFAFKYNSFEKIIALAYSQETNQSLKTSGAVMVLQIPYIKVSDLIDAKPEFTLSKGNQSQNASYQIRESSVSFLPETFELVQNYPNPFNPSTMIGYEVPENNSIVHIAVYNTIGQNVETLVNKYKSAGTYSIRWNADNLPSGMYLVKMSSGKFSKTIKAMLMK